MPIKTREVKRILDPIETQVNKLRELVRGNRCEENDGSTTSDLLERLEVLGGKFDDLLGEEGLDYQEMKSRITEAVEEFCSSDNFNKAPKDTNGEALEEAVTRVFDKFVLAFEALERVECLPLKQRLVDCLDYVREMGAANEIEHFQNIKELGTSILELLQPLQRYKRSLISQFFSEKMILYCCQLCTSFKLLVRLVQEQHRLNAPIYNCKKYVCERVCFCLEMLIGVLDAADPEPEAEISERENHFVYRMDIALDQLAELFTRSHEEQASECQELWSSIEEVFSYAMAIAQVCNPYNFKAITGACQAIVSKYENLRDQLTSDPPDLALNNLFMNTLNDALYRLERKVNVAMLNLVLEVFADPFSPLRKLVMTCGNALSAKKRSKADLTDAIEDFDQIIDKSIQIGLFAVASCKDRNRKNQIRNCLAGLESLETELVSAITAFYLHPDSKEMRTNVKLLTGQWQLEINKLQESIYLIMDPAAYCEVVWDELQARVTEMSDCLDNRQPVTQCQVQGVVQRALSLSRQISGTLDDIGTDVVERQTIMMIRELKAAIFEADAAAKTLLTENATEPQQLRVIKRCELILNVVKRLQPAMATVMSNTVSMSSHYGKSARGQGDSGHEQLGSELPYVRTPYTVKNYKCSLSIQPANSAPRSQLDLSCLLPYIKKGREMRTERSVMYKTPGREKKTTGELSATKLSVRKPSNIRQHIFSRDSSRCSSEDPNLTEESMDLTEILEKFVSSCATLNTSTYRTEKTTVNAETVKESAVNNLSDTFARKLEVQPGPTRANRIEEGAAGGDGHEVSKSFNSTANTGVAIEIVQRQLFKD